MGEERGLVFFSPNVLLFHLMLVQEPRWRALSRRPQRLASGRRLLVYKERTICPIESGRGENYNNPWVCPGLLLYQSFLVSDIYILFVHCIKQLLIHSCICLFNYFIIILSFLHPFILMSILCHILSYVRSFLQPFILASIHFYIHSFLHPSILSFITDNSVN